MKNADTAVIVGRFQVHDLHEGHKKLIDAIQQFHEKIVIFLGVAKFKSKQNPLDYISREKMIKEYYPNITVCPISDQFSDDVWSKELDSRIREISPNGTIILYGGRDSFISHYTGKFPTEEILFQETVKFSSTEIRRQLSRVVENNKYFRHGVIYATETAFDRINPTVDVAILKKLEGAHGYIWLVLLGRKKGEWLWRFPGGFVDIKDKSYEQAARREAFEETNIDITDPEYISSIKIDDWRGTPDSGIMTSFYKCYLLSGKEKAKDDLEEIKWFNTNELNEVSLMPNHIILKNILLKHLDAHGF